MKLKPPSVIVQVHITLFFFFFEEGWGGCDSKKG